MGERNRLVSGEEIRRAAATVKMDQEKREAIREKIVGKRGQENVVPIRKEEKNG